MNRFVSHELFDDVVSPLVWNDTFVYCYFPFEVVNLLGNLHEHVNQPPCFRNPVKFRVVYIPHHLIIVNQVEASKDLLPPG
jgi:hypothetical protein